ncbi:unnamed protein product [Ectocarpus sp. 13 AM-2016]
MTRTPAKPVIIVFSGLLMLIYSPMYQVSTSVQQHATLCFGGDGLSSCCSMSAVSSRRTKKTMLTAAAVDYSSLQENRHVLLLLLSSPQYQPFVAVSVEYLHTSVPVQQTRKHSVATG